MIMIFCFKMMNSTFKCYSLKRISELTKSYSIALFFFNDLIYFKLDI